MENVRKTKGRLVGAYTSTSAPFSLPVRGCWLFWRNLLEVKWMERRIIRKPELFSKLSLSDATIWRMERAGKFPVRISLGGNSVGWFVNEIDEWLAKKAADRTGSRVRVVGVSR